MFRYLNVDRFWSWKRPLAYRRFSDVLLAIQRQHLMMKESFVNETSDPRSISHQSSYLGIRCNRVCCWLVPSPEPRLVSVPEKVENKLVSKTQPPTDDLAVAPRISKATSLQTYQREIAVHISQHNSDKIYVTNPQAMLRSVIVINSPSMPKVSSYRATCCAVIAIVKQKK